MSLHSVPADEQNSVACNISNVLDLARARNEEQFIAALRNYDAQRSPKKAFSDIIKFAVNHIGISLSTLARLCKTSPTNISRWSKGSAPSCLVRELAVAQIQSYIESGQ
jgi:hypothetical protein